jgi:dihydroorotate dehydrogenase
MYKLIRPILFSIPPEAAHRFAMHTLRLSHPILPAFKSWLVHEEPRLARTVLGLRFKNPLGLAAGFDKYAECVDAWQHLGFGFIELGTITRHAQPGNPKPRVFRYPGQRALINRFGFNNHGADATAERLQALRDAGRWPSIPVGINLGKSKVTPVEAATEDYVYSAERLRGFADYVAINVSSPNTPGLRSLQGSAAIRRLVRSVRKACTIGKRKLPLLVKFSPDMVPKELLASVDAALAAGADGIILTNTTLSRAGLPGAEHPEGGLSGLPVRALADATLAAVARHTRGRVPLVGVGGVFNAADARRKLELGASLVQGYTGFIYQGPSYAQQILRGLPLRASRGG